MNVLVCIKPDLLGQEIGPFETLAVEAALTLKDSGQASRVDVITAGPAQWREIIVRALGMGADQGCHIVTPENEGSMDGGESLVPASITADRLRRALCRRHVELPYDLIFTGVMSQDWMAGQTGPMLAEYLGVALATSVVKISAVPGGIRAVRQLEGGRAETLELPLPALVTVQAGEYTPRYPSLSNMLRAKSAPISTLVLEPDSPMSSEILLETALPETRRAGERIGGSLEEQVGALNAFLREKGLI